eukprot:3990853-Pyramimonas_sp.AAC.1
MLKVILGSLRPSRSHLGPFWTLKFAPPPSTPRGTRATGALRARGIAIPGVLAAELPRHLAGLQQPTRGRQYVKQNAKQPISDTAEVVETPVDIVTP